MKKTHRTHSQPRFSCAAVGVSTTKSSFPELRAKAHNCLMVTAWLADVTSKEAAAAAPGSHKSVRARCCMGFWQIYGICLKAENVNWLNDSEVEEIKMAGRCALFGINHLAVEAMPRKTPKARYACRPKLHMLWHIIDTAVSTKRNLLSSWTMSSESSMGIYAKLAEASNPSHIGLGVRRWLVSFFRLQSPAELRLTAANYS